MRYLEVEAAPRYWEDAEVNGIVDETGSLIPCKIGNLWKPIIDLEEKRIINWEIGNYAKIHYKVCDCGEYYLLDENKNRIKKYYSSYVPDEMLSVGRSGYGDYIIMKIDKNGNIENYNPKIIEEQWEDL